MESDIKKKRYRSDELRKVFNLPEDSITPKLDSKLSAALTFIERFQSVENTFSFIIDFTTMKYLYMSESTIHVTGHKNWREGGVEYAMSQYHPEDEKNARKIHAKKLEHYYSIPNEDRLKYKYTHDFRIKHAKGHYIRINHHALYLHKDEKGNPLSALCLCNDITDLKKCTTLNLEISKLNEQGGFTPVLKEYYPLSDKLHISSREYEVLTSLSEGETNRQIAEKLFISEHTVRDHRRNMLRKNNAKTIGELISLAWQNELF